jgi:hypothetical protein
MIVATRSMVRSNDEPAALQDFWAELRLTTQSRIGLGRQLAARPVIGQRARGRPVRQHDTDVCTGLLDRRPQLHL